MQAALKESKKAAKAERRKTRDNERSAFADEISPEGSSLSSDSESSNEEQND